MQRLTYVVFINVTHCYGKRPCQSCMGSSLVPRPLPPPVFDCILYAKTEGEGLGERVMCVTSGRREGRREGGGDLTKNLEVLLVIFCAIT